MSTYFASTSEFPSSVGTICLPSETFPDSETLTALGWGGTDAAVTQSELLKEVQGDSGGLRLGWVDLDLRCSTILLGQ